MKNDTGLHKAAAYTSTIISRCSERFYIQLIFSEIRINGMHINELENTCPYTAVTRMQDEVFFR